MRTHALARTHICEVFMRSFLLMVAAGLMMLLIAVGSHMARSARANAHTAVVATQR